MPDTASLYDRDWFAWTQDQAQQLRALRPNGLDVEHLAEEVEDLGRSQRRAVASLLLQVVEHLLKLEFHPATDSRHHWQGEIDTFRAQIEVEFEDSPSLRASRRMLFDGAWTRARRSFLRRLAREHPIEAERVERALPPSAVPRYALDEQVLNDEWFPTPEEPG